MESLTMDSGVSKEYLQQLGRQAASIHSSRGASMTDSVVAVLNKEAGLTPEHVKRVVEFANNEAYRDVFDRMDGEHRIVNLENGPANPADVMRELEMPDSAPAIVKSAAHAESLRRFIPGEEEFEDFFDKAKTAGEALPAARPHGSLADFRSQLMTAKSTLMTKLSSVEIDHAAASDEMYDIVKQEVLGGTSPAEVSNLFRRISPSPIFTKMALQFIADKMEPEGIPAVVCSPEMIKKASSRPINHNHPLVKSFESFIKLATDRVTLIRGIQDIDSQLKRVNKTLYEAMR